MKELARQKKQPELARAEHQGMRSRPPGAFSPRTSLRPEKAYQTELGWDRWLPINYRLG